MANPIAKSDPKRATTSLTRVCFVKDMSRVWVARGDYQRRNPYQVKSGFDLLLERALTDSDFVVLSKIARDAYEQGKCLRLCRDRPNEIGRDEIPRPYVPDEGELFSGTNRAVVMRIAGEAFLYGEADQRSVTGYRFHSSRPVCYEDEDDWGCPGVG